MVVVRMCERNGGHPERGFVRASHFVGSFPALEAVVEQIERPRHCEWTATASAR